MVPPGSDVVGAGARGSGVDQPYYPEVEQSDAPGLYSGQSETTSVLSRPAAPRFVQEQDTDDEAPSDVHVSPHTSTNPINIPARAAPSEFTSGSQGHRPSLPRITSTNSPPFAETGPQRFSGAQFSVPKQLGGGGGAGGFSHMTPPFADAGVTSSSGHLSSRGVERRIHKAAPSIGPSGLGRSPSLPAGAPGSAGTPVDSFLQGLAGSRATAQQQQNAATVTESALRNPLIASSMMDDLDFAAPGDAEADKEAALGAFIKQLEAAPLLDMFRLGESPDSGMLAGHTSQVGAGGSAGPAGTSSGGLGSSSGRQGGAAFVRVSTLTNDINALAMLQEELVRTFNSSR